MSRNVIKRNVASALILNSNEEILLQKKTSDYIGFPNKWCLFGGGIEEGESPEEAIKRELLEELEYVFETDFIKKLRYRTDFEGGSREGELYLFRTFYEGPISGLRLKEGADFGFFNLEELKGLNMLERHRIIIEDYFKEQIRN